VKLSTDYDHSANFVGIKHIPGPRWKPLISIWDARVKSAVDKELATEGRTQAPIGRDVSLEAVETTRTKQQLNTFLRRLRGLAPGWIRKCDRYSREDKVGGSQAREWRDSQVELCSACSAMIDSSLSFIFSCPAGIHSR
jgi:hypothetical protein